MGIIRRTLNPAWYHGDRAKPPFFEGWYFKLIDASGLKKIAIIPGISIGKDASASHAFIQVLDGVKSTSHYQDYPVSDFNASRESFNINIGASQFSESRLNLDIESNELSLHGQVQLGELQPWPVSLTSPGIMGWYAWIPFMECFHGVLSLDHTISGSLNFNGQEINFDSGRGYLEKDWGRAFPKGYIWFQTNHFGQPGISLTASVAIIPWIRQPFPGFIVGFLCDGRLYQFTKYNGARIVNLEINDDNVIWSIKRKGLLLEMQAHRSHGGILKAPTIDGMDRRIVESMNSSVDVRLTERGVTIFEGTGEHCGLEAAGDIERLLALQRHQ